MELNRIFLTWSAKLALGFVNGYKQEA